ncbi:nSTAND1 domain-containing NTPase [Amycolatopsis magusensis]|uniref:nSTAND1 domain-containing NTPase n=1 Tax=Amycolatopsis magusensis TaxID=882444 RepID=UPI0037BC511D
MDDRLGEGWGIVPRAERPLELDGSLLTTFAADLRELRKNAGSPPYRELARRSHFSSTTLSDAAGGRRLPSLEVTLAYVRACGGDAEQWEQRWRAAATQLHACTTSGEADDDQTAPYVGLRAYGREDAELFFGRERLVDDLVARVRRQRFVAVFGPSGSGKSSVLRAGLIPRLSGTVLCFTPGSHPVEECAIHLARLTGELPGSVHTELAGDPRAVHRLVRQALAPEPAGAEIVLVVDQFEELFTLCADDQQRERFLALILTAASEPRSRCRVVLGVRADFYPHCSRLPQLVEALQDAQVTVGPMAPEDLRRAIVQPAVQARCTIESSLLTTLVTHVHGQPGALPLLSHALLQTWSRRKGNTLTLAGYQATGGFDGALANTAEAVFTGLDEGRQTVARDLFRRLVTLGEDTGGTKRRISAGELDEDPIVVHVVAAFVQTRLLTQDRGSLELAHEVLIKAWPRLAGWLAEDRDGQRTQRELTEATAAWERHGRDDTALLRGPRLAVLNDWATRASAPNSKESTFLNASIAAEQREQAAKRRAERRQRRLIAVLTVLLLVAATATIYATKAEERAVLERNMALALSVTNQVVELSQTSPSLAAQLSLAAYRLAPSPATRDSLIATSAATSKIVLQSGTGAIPAVSGNGQAILVSDRDQDSTFIKAADQDGYPYGFLPGGMGASVSDDGLLAATIDRDNRVHLSGLKDLANPAGMAVLPGTYGSALISSNGRLMAAAETVHKLASPMDPPNWTPTGTVRIWDLAVPQQPRQTGELHAITLRSFAGNHALATSPYVDAADPVPDDNSIRLWKLSETGTPTTTTELLPSYSPRVNSYFSPQGSLAITKKIDHETLTVWALHDQLQSTQRVSSNIGIKSVTAANFSANEELAALGSPGEILVQNLRTNDAQVRINLPGRQGVVKGLAFGNNDRGLVGVTWGPGADTYAWRWELDPEKAAAAVCNDRKYSMRPAEWEKFFSELEFRPPCP